VHLTNFEKDLTFEARLFPFLFVDLFDFGRGAIKVSD